MAETSLEIGKVHLKYHLYPHLLITVLFLGVSPLFLGLSNLNGPQTARVLDMYVSLSGIILLVPLFLPENDRNIRELVESKYISQVRILGIRLFESFFCLAVLLAVFVGVLEAGNCRFPLGAYYLGTLAGALFLGGLGIFSWALSDQAVVGYMIPMMYYVGNFGGARYFGKFYLFSMMEGNPGDKIWLAGAGILFILAGIGCRIRRK